MWLYCFHFFIPLPILIVGTIFLLPFLDVVRMSKSTVSFFLDSGILTQQNALLWCVIRLLEVVSVSYLWALSNYFSYMLFIFIFLYFFNSILLVAVLSENQTWSNRGTGNELHFTWYWHTFLHCCSTFCIYWISTTNQSFWEVSFIPSKSLYLACYKFLSKAIQILRAEVHIWLNCFAILKLLLRM